MSDLAELIYFGIDEAMRIHHATIEKSGGGTYEAIDSGRLESVLEHIQNHDYYPTIEDKLTHLFWGACKFHCFADGNKRIALTLCTQFLLLNGYLFIGSNFIKLFENITYHVASGAINEFLLHEIIESVFNGEFESEEIKLKIYNAISKELTND